MASLLHLFGKCGGAIYHCFAKCLNKQYVVAYNRYKSHFKDSTASAASTGSAGAAAAAGSNCNGSPSGASTSQAVNDIHATSDQGQPPTATSSTAAGSTSTNAGTLPGAAAPGPVQPQGPMCDMADSFRTYLKDIYSVFALLVSFGQCPS